MKITFLGTATSTGIPEIGCSCKVCRSSDAKDKRMRCSALVEVKGKRLLIDCGPDFRTQMLHAAVDRLDALLITHEHYDHVGGLDDIRPLLYRHSFDIFLEKNVAQAIQTRMPYAFGTHKYPGVPELNLQLIDNQPFMAAGIPIIPIRIMHARLPILGFRIGKMAYLSDIKTIPEEEFSKLKGLDLLVIEALRYGEHPSHIGVEEALILIDRIQPKEARFTHLSHRIGLHRQVNEILPPHVRLAYDGLVMELDEAF